MCYKMQASIHILEQGLNYNLQHIRGREYVQVSRIPQGHRPRSELQALRAYADYSTDLEMTCLS